MIEVDSNKHLLNIWDWYWAVPFAIAVSYHQPLVTNTSDCFLGW